MDFPSCKPDDLVAVQQTHARVEMTPFGDARLAYSVVLPKGWRNEPDLGKQVDEAGLLVRIGLFSEARRDDPCVVQVFYTRMPTEVPLIDWLEDQSIKTGVRPNIRQVQSLAAGDVADLGGTYGPANNQFVVRNFAFSDDARIFMVSSMSRLDRYPANARSIAIAGSFFHLLKPTGSPRLEHWLSQESARPGFRCGHPASWSARQVPTSLPGKSAIDIYLAKNEQMLAYVRVKMTDLRVAVPTSLPSTQIATEELQEAAVKTESGWKADSDPYLGMISNLVDAFQANGSLSNRPVELSLARTRHGQFEFAFTLITIPKVYDAMLWMRSRRAYQIAIETARPN